MARLRSDRGFGLVELLIAMGVMQIGVLAVVAAFTSGAIAINRASKTTTAAALADAQMETFRALISADIGVDTSAGTLGALDSAYTNDVACWDANASKNCTQIPDATLTADGMALIAPSGSTACSTIDGWFPNTKPCTPSRLVTDATTPASPDGRSYRIDTYVVELPAVNADAPALAQRARKQVTIVVRDPAVLTHVLVRETSIFDCSTGSSPDGTC